MVNVNVNAWSSSSHAEMRISAASACFEGVFFPADGAESELQGLSAGGADSGAAEGGSSVPGGLSSGRPRGHGGDAR